MRSRHAPAAGDAGASASSSAPARPGCSRPRSPTGGAIRRPARCPADFDYAGSHNSYSLAAFMREILGLEGPSAVVSSACSSSAKVFASARRMIAAGVIDAAVVGGVDSLCLTTLYGFHSLQLVSARPCRPFDVARDGISIGEAAAFALSSARRTASIRRHPVAGRRRVERCLSHVIAPPRGPRRRAAMLRALAGAALAPQDIDYINLHGTGTPSNDNAEGKAVAACLPSADSGAGKLYQGGHRSHARRGWRARGRDLRAGAAARTSPWDVNRNGSSRRCGFEYLRANGDRPIARALSNSFGFGGSNCALILGRAGWPDPAVSPALGAYIQGIGLLGPGLRDWQGGARAIAGEERYWPGPTRYPRPKDCLRRSAAEPALPSSSPWPWHNRPSTRRRRPGRTARVFSSSGGDGVICHEICEALASADRQVSPTRFHNSVHNAAAGYWSLATGATAASTALCAHDGSFAAGLLEALALLTVEGRVLLSAYETTYPEPLHAKRPLPDSFAVALVLTPGPAPNAGARVTVNPCSAEAAGDRLADPQLEALHAALPAARSLPLLRLLGPP